MARLREISQMLSDLDNMLVIMGLIIIACLSTEEPSQLQLVIAGGLIGYIQKNGSHKEKQNEAS